MLYLKHDFFHNFTNAVKSGDKKVAHDILFDELAKILAFDKNKLISEVNESGVKTPNMNNKAVIKAILKNWEANPNLRKRVLSMIKINHMIKGKNEAPFEKTFNDFCGCSFDGNASDILANKTDEHLANKEFMQTPDKVFNVRRFGLSMAAFTGMIIVAGYVGIMIMDRWILKKFDDGGSINPNNDSLSNNPQPGQQSSQQMQPQQTIVQPAQPAQQFVQPVAQETTMVNNSNVQTSEF